MSGLGRAVTSALPNGIEAYFFQPLLIMHVNGSCYGVLGSANQAAKWTRGCDDRDRELFYLADLDGNRITIKDNLRAPGHASAILAALDRADAARPEGSK